MMIDPTTFKESLKNESLAEIIKVRDSIIKEIQEYEREESSDEIVIASNPDPETIYFCNLSYLSEICDLIQEKIKENGGY